MDGPEMGKPIMVEEDVWIGGSAIICPGVTLGKGCVVGAGSVVTKVCCFPCKARGQKKYEIPDSDWGMRWWNRVLNHTPW